MKGIMSTSYAFSVVSYPAYKGTKSGRFELRDGDPLVQNGTRAEVSIVDGARGEIEKEAWYSFAVYFPDTDFERDSEPEIISQWHQHPDEHLGEKSQSPATFFQIKDDRFIFDTGFNSKRVSNGVDKSSRQKVDLGHVTKNTWHQWVFHFVHSYGADGMIEVWHNNRKVFRSKGGNMYNNDGLPYWKLGVYKWRWNDSLSSDTNKRVLYFDNVRVGSSNASYEQMISE